MKRLTIGLAAHVDAGKTTLSEALLYTAGAIRRLGRVDSRDAFLDTDAVEKERGITIFSKQAVLQTGDAELTLIDTPGHVDFSAETERVLGILDACVLVISAADGVQAHTRTLAGLLEAYHVPVIVFVNKMDQPGADREALMRNLQSQFSEACVDFSPEAEDARAEALAMCSEELMEKFLADGQVREDSLQKAVMARQVFPCFFGSALKLSGIEELLEAIPQLLSEPAYPETFAARVFKILRDDPDVSDHGKGLDHDLPRIAGVGQGFEVPGHAGGEDQLADAVPGGADGRTFKDPAVGKCQISHVNPHRALQP